MFLICDVMEVHDESRTHLILIKVRFKVVNGAHPAFNLKASGMRGQITGWPTPGSGIRKVVILEPVAQCRIYCLVFGSSPEGRGPTW
jgi:hypothetical protein